ncbi:Immunoglobulin-like domain, partial [Trinorchestia longiramus]
EGLNWALEPQQEAQFSNNTGGALHCAGRGRGPAVTWHYQDGRPVLQIPGILEVLSNGSLWFPPFPSSRFDPSVHRGTFTCTISDPSGALISRPARVVAGLDEEYEARAEDAVARVGGWALLRCLVPRHLRDIVRVKDWVRDGSVLVLPALHR